MTGLSPAQQAIWYEEQLSAGNGGSFSVTLCGPLAEEHLRAACAAVVRRHPPLRTVVRDGPVPEVLPAGTPPAYQVADVPCPPGGEARAARDWRERTGPRPFDLTRRPGIAFALLRHAPDRRTLLVVVHHFCFDGRSKFVFAREFTAALTALRAGRSPDPPEAPGFGWPPGEPAARDRAVAYWHRLLPDHPPPRLPRGTAPSAAVGTTGELVIDGATRDRLAALAAAAGTTLFGALLATLAAQLNAYGNERVAVSVPVDVTTPGTRDLIGLAVNVVPVAVAVRAGDTFQSVLSAARAATDHLRATRRVPFRELTSGAPWSAGARDLFSRVSISYLRLPPDLPTIPGLTTAWDFVAPNSARTFGLMFHLRDATDHLLLRVDHAGTTTDDSTATTIATHFRTTATLLSTHPTTALHDLPLTHPVPPEATHPARPDGESAGRTRAADTTPLLHPLLEICTAGACRHLDAVAVAGPSGRLSYRELAGLVGLTDPADPAGTGLAGTADGMGIHRMVRRIAEVAGFRAVDDVTPPSGGRSAAALRWLAGRLHRGEAGPVRTLSLARPGSAAFWEECHLTWIRGGTLHVAASVWTPGTVAETVAEAVRRCGITTVLAPANLVRELAVTATPSPEAVVGPTSLRDVVVPVGELRPWGEVVVLARAGVRVHARYVVGGGTVGVQECTAGGLAGADDPLLELADGVRVEVRTGDGRVVPGGVTGRLVVDGRDTGDLGWIDPAGALRYEGTARDTVVWYGLALNIPTVERRLVTHPAVADAVVTVAAVGGPHPARDSGAAGGPHRGRGDGTGGGSCAHVQPWPGVELAVPELRRHLRTRARPGELMPSRIHVVPALPRLPDGTADRTALRDSAMPENR